MHLVTTAEMRTFEKAADASGLTYDEMMRRAGTAVARFVDERYGAGSVEVLVGPGNNGGDALVASAALHDSGCAMRAWVWKRGLTGDPLIDALRQRGIPLEVVARADRLPELGDALARADVVLDGLLGTGASRPIEGLLGEMLATLAQALDEGGAAVVAVDVPTGLDCDTGAVDPYTVPAQATVTFGYPKIGQFTLPGAEYIGELVIDNIGIPATTEPVVSLTTEDEVSELLPERPMHAHKGTFGKALVVAGSANYTGAAYLAASAAYRAGCGLVTAALPESLHPIIAGLVPEATFVLLSEDLGVIARSAAEVLAERWAAYDAALLGPGLTTEQAASEFVEAVLASWNGHPARAIGFGTPAPETQAGHPGRPKHLVVDADGLNLLARLPDGLAQLPPETVLTPHPGEMARLIGGQTAEVNAARIDIARTWAQTWGHVVVLKGAFTVVAAPDGRESVNPFADPALARAGTGDVLAGTIVGLLAQGLAPFDAARTGAYIHGLAGQLAGDRKGRRAVLAGDVLDSIAEALQELEL